MKADFETIAAVLSFISNSVGIALLHFVLQQDKLKKNVSEIEESIKSKMSDYHYLKRKRKSLIRMLWNPFLYILHLLNLSILTAIVIVLIYGPIVFFGAEPSSSLSEPLTTTEERLYIIWLLGGLIGYSLKGIIPTFALFSLSFKSKKWLKTNEPSRN